MKSHGVVCAVLVCAFARPPRDALALADDAESSLVHPFLTNIRSVCFALAGAAGILLTRPLLDRLGLVLTDGQYASLAFTVLLLFQLINLLEYESEKSLFTGNLRLNVVFCGLLAAMAVFLLVCFLSPAAGALFGIERIPGLSWIAVAVLALVYLGLHEIFKLIAGRKK